MDQSPKVIFHPHTHIPFVLPQNLRVQPQADPDAWEMPVVKFSMNAGYCTLFTE